MKKHKQEFIDKLNELVIITAQVKEVADKYGYVLPSAPYFGELNKGDKCVDCGKPAVTTLDGAPCCYDCWNSEH